MRTSYNDYVLDYNNAIQTFPGSVFANTFHFVKADFFQAPPEADEPVKVNFDDVNNPPSASTGAPAAAPKAAGRKGGKKAASPPSGGTGNASS